MGTYVTCVQHYMCRWRQGMQCGAHSDPTNKLDPHRRHVSSLQYHDQNNSKGLTELISIKIVGILKNVNTWEYL